MVRCDELEGWEGGVGGRFKKEGIYVYLRTVEFGKLQSMGLQRIRYD